MKRGVFILSLLITAGLWAQTREPIDLVLLLDTSASMSASYNEVADYLSGPFLQEQLQIGDTFHLISFAASPALELSRRIEGRGDIQTIVGRILILYPVNPETDVVSALEFGRRYVAGLPQSRTKRVFLISDGDHGPDGGPYAGLSQEEGRRRIDSAAESYRSLGAEFRYIAVPLSRTAASGPAVSSSAAPAQGPGQAVPSQSVPAQGAPVQSPGQGAVPSQGAQPQGPSQDASAQDLPAQGAPSQSPSQDLPAQSPSQGVPAQDAVPGQGVPSQGPRRGASGPAGNTAAGRGFALPLPLIIGLIAAAIVALAVALLLTGRNLRSSPKRAMARAASASFGNKDAQRARDNAALLASYAANQRKGGSRTPANYRRRTNTNEFPQNGPLMLSLFVEDQNTLIGKRNIHTVKAGYTFSVGGGRSDFLIFLVSVPPHIADVRFDGKNCTFIPRKPQYFPDLGPHELPNCIGENIRVISDKNYEFHIRVERYQDPLITLNRMLRSIELPGLPEF